MGYHYITRRLAAAVCFMLFQCVCSGPIQKQSKLSVPEHAPVHKRSANTVQFFMSSESHNNLIHRDEPQEVVASASVQDFDYSLVCPESVSTGLDDPVHKRSVCPWYYRVSHDARRFPAVVLSAESLCDYAIGSQGSLECVPITQNLPVLRQQNYRDTETGDFVWQEEQMTVVIGYTAAGRRIAESATAAAPNNQPTPEWEKR